MLNQKSALANIASNITNNDNVGKCLKEVLPDKITLCYTSGKPLSFVGILSMIDSIKKAKDEEHSFTYYYDESTKEFHIIEMSKDGGVILSSNNSFFDTYQITSQENNGVSLGIVTLVNNTLCVHIYSCSNDGVYSGISFALDEDSTELLNNIDSRLKLYELLNNKDLMIESLNSCGIIPENVVINVLNNASELVSYIKQYNEQQGYFIRKLIPEE